MESRDGSILDDIEAYNRDDCVFILTLRNWLEERRADAVVTSILRRTGAPPPDDLVDGAPTAEIAMTPQADTAERAPTPVDARTSPRTPPSEREEPQQARWLLAGLLDWHRREAKPQWWDYFRLVEASLEELVRDGSALAATSRSSRTVGAGARGRSIHRYRFDPAQETQDRARASP